MNHCFEFVNTSVARSNWVANNPNMAGLYSRRILEAAGEDKAMARFEVGDEVRVDMPKGVNKRGVVGISVLYTTWPEARFDGATGDVAEVNPRGPLGIPLYLVNFRGHENRVTVPWQSEWFREEWLLRAGERPTQEPAKTGELAAASGAKDSTIEESS